MRILVTGASGQVGWATVRRLQSCAIVIGSDRKGLDLSRPEAISATLDAIAPELVINAAAYTAVDRSEEEPELAQRVNAKAPAAMARWCEQRGVPLIHFSTDYVFDGRGDRPWSEDDLPRTLSAYGASKLAGEKQIAAAGGCFLIVRTSWIYAAQGTNFLCKVAALAQANRELRIVADQIGAPTSAALVADCLARMLENGLPTFRAKAAQARGLVHLTARGEASWHDFATEIVNGLRSRGIDLAVERVTPIRTDDYPLPAQRPRNSRLDLTRVQSVFGITPPHWREALSPELDALTHNLRMNRHEAQLR